MGAPAAPRMGGAGKHRVQLKRLKSEEEVELQMECSDVGFGAQGASGTLWETQHSVASTLWYENF